MNPAIVISDELRSKIAREISQMARMHPRASMAGDLFPAFFDECVDGVAELIDLNATDDFETAVVVAMAKWKKQNNHAFLKRRPKSASLRAALLDYNPARLWRPNHE
jgi:hypothetical protein